MKSLSKKELESINGGGWLALALSGAFYLWDNWDDVSAGYAGGRKTL